MSARPKSANPSPPFPPPLSDEELLALRKAGLSIPAIAESTGFNYYTIRDRVRRLTK